MNFVFENIDDILKPKVKEEFKAAEKKLIKDMQEAFEWAFNSLDDLIYFVERGNVEYGELRLRLANIEDRVFNIFYNLPDFLRAKFNNSIKKFYTKKNKIKI